MEKYPEYETLQSYPVFKSITIERYVQLRNAFPMADSKKAVESACLASGDPDNPVKRPDAYLRTFLSKAPEIDIMDIPYALGGVKMRYNDDGTPNQADEDARKKAL